VIAPQLVPVEVTIQHDGVRLDVMLLGEPTANPDLVVVPRCAGTRIFLGDEDEPADPFVTGWTVLHRPSRLAVVNVSFDLDDARTVASRLAHLDWARVTREATKSGGHPYAAEVSRAISRVGFW
jgi:hypothetical protein